MGLLGLALACLAIAACGSSNSSGGSGSSAATPSAAGGASTSANGKQAKVAYFALTLASAYDSAEEKSAKAEAQKLGAQYTVYDGKLDPNTQVNECRQAVVTGQSNIFVIKAVSGPPLLPCVRQALAKGIKVVAIDDPLGPAFTLKPQVPGLTGSVLSLPQTEAQAQLKMTLAACGSINPCNIAWYYGSQTFVFFTQAFADYKKLLAQHSNLKLIGEEASNFQVSTAATATRALLETHPDVNVIVSDSDQGALGAIKGLQASGKKGVKVIGSGASCAGVAAIKAGTLYGSSSLYPASMGRTAVQLGVKAVQGKPLGKTEIDQSFSQPIGPTVTKANVSQIKCEW